MKQTNLRSWVLVVQNSARHTYQILDESSERRKPAWERFLRAVAKAGLHLYGIDLIL